VFKNEHCLLGWTLDVQATIMPYESDESLLVGGHRSVGFTVLFHEQFG
jgi:hypothetical protein